MKKWGSFIGILCFTMIFLVPLLAQNQVDKQKIREELIQELDQKLAKVRQELIEKIDQKLFAKANHSSFLGVEVSSVTPGLRTLLGLPDKQGLLVQKVMENSPAKQAGMEKLDILLSFAGQDLTTPEELSSLVSSYPPGSEINLEILRRNQKKMIAVRLGKKEVKQSQPVKTEKKNSPWEDLLGENGGNSQDLAEVEKKMRGFLEGMQGEKFLENLQKNMEEQLREIQEDPKKLEELNSVLQQFGGKGLKDILKQLENQKNQKQGEVEEETIPEDDLDSLLEDLENFPSKSNPKKNTNGLSFIQIPDSVRDKENFYENHGVLISNVNKNSLAAKAGVKKWDILLEINGEKVSTPKSVQKSLSQLEGSEVKLKLFSKGKEQEISLELLADGK